MKHKTLLLLTDHRLTAWQWTAGQCDNSKSFAPSDLAGFDTYLRQHRHPIWMLVDLTEEAFHYEGLPHINDLDHYAAALQRLAGHFPDTPLRMVVKQFKQTQIGKDDEMLYSALTQPARLAPWLEAIAAQHIALAGIYSVAHLSSLLLKGSELEHQLLVTQDAAAGVRIAYFYKNRLRFSRLGSPGGLTERAVIEARQTRPYLISRRLLPRDQPLTVTVLCAGDTWHELTSRTAPDPELPLRPLDLAGTAQRLGLPYSPAGSDATPLFLHLLATQPPIRQYAPEALTLRFRQRHTRRALYTLALLLASAMTVWGITNLWHARQQDAESAALRQQTQRLLLQESQIRLQLGELPATASDIRTVVDRLRSLDQAPPQNLLLGLSHILTDFPTVQLLKLEWQNTQPAPTVLLEFIAAPEQPEQLDQFRRALTVRGYHLVELQDQSSEAPTVPRHLWQVSG